MTDKPISFYGEFTEFPILVATLALDEALKRATCRIARAADVTDGKRRCNSLPPDYRRAILESAP